MTSHYVKVEGQALGHTKPISVHNTQAHVATGYHLASGDTRRAVPKARNFPLLGDNSRTITVLLTHEPWFLSGHFGLLLLADQHTQRTVPILAGGDDPDPKECAGYSGTGGIARKHL